MLIEPGRHPAYYLPYADFISDGPALLGDAAGPLEAERLGLTPGDDYLTVRWDAVRWFEEDEEVFRHPRNPYARVDAVASSRRVQIVLDGVTLADTVRAVFLFETGLITRYYMPRKDVRQDLLRESAASTYCPYKGRALYHGVALNGRLHPDIVWYYPDPYPEARKIAGLICFYNEKVGAVLVDGQVALPRFPMRI
jgi:uncharacterized protein (DUF427 family)